MLETFLSGANFTDMLAEMSSQLDAADQDKALAAQVAEDRDTLLSLHETVVEARAATNTIRQETAVQKQKLDQRLKELKAAQAQLKALERQAEAALRAERAQYARMAADEKRMRADARGDGGGEAPAPEQDQPARREAVQPGQHPVAVQRDAALADGRRRDPGLRLHRASCTSRRWAAAPTGTTASTSSRPYGTPVHASGAGRVVYVGWNYADGADPAWIVIIAHSQGLSTWYAHMQSRYKVRAGQRVSQGQVIGYEGNTGHSTGAHLHWMVEFNGNFVNPRLFT